MKIKSFFYLVLFTCSAILSSCGRDSKVSDKKTTISTSVNTPQELQQLNVQLQAQPNNPDLYYKRALYYLNSKKYDESFADITHVLKIDSSKSEYFLTLSDLYFIANKTGNAKQALEKSISLDNKNVDAMLKLAELYLYVRKNEQSMKYINMALKVNQYSAKAYFMKGMNYKEMKDTARAISSMQTAVEQDQQYYNAYIQLGILCAAKKKPLAVQYYKNAIRIQANSEEAWYNLGKFYQDTENWNSAIEVYTILIKINPSNKYAHYNMGVINLVHFKKYDLAISHFTEAIKIDTKYVQAYYGRGVCSQTKKDVKQAVIDFQACLDINPKFEPAQLALKQLNAGY
jgi:tetratricopeptide (TPR) repeat protein